MSLGYYFENNQGFGVLSTADGEGNVNAAVYARPHCFEDGTVGFIMPDRRTHSYLRHNDRAVYLFHEQPQADGPSYAGKRLFLKKVDEEHNTDRIEQLRRRRYGDDRDGRYLVRFCVTQELPLIGAGSEN